MAVQEELNRLLTACVMIRRRKIEVLAQLPPKRRQQIFLHLKDKQAKKIKSQSAELATVNQMMMGRQQTAGFNSEQLQLMSNLYMSTADAKVEAVQEYVRDMLEMDDVKFLIFAHHKCLLDGIEKQCITSKVSYIRIDGQTDVQERDVLRRKFQEDEKCRVAVLSIRAAGTGLNLTAASTVIFAELTWVPGEILQAEDRVHRIGQESIRVNIHFLMAHDSIDEIIWNAIQNKLDDVGRVLDGVQDSLKVVAPAEIREHGQMSIEDFSLLQESQPVSSLADRPGKKTGVNSQLQSQSQGQTSIDRFFKKGSKRDAAEMLNTYETQYK